MADAMDEPKFRPDTVTEVLPVKGEFAEATLASGASSEKPRALIVPTTSLTVICSLLATDTEVVSMPHSTDVDEVHAVE